MSAIRIDSSKAAKLSDIPTTPPEGITSEIAQKELQKLGEQLARLQSLMYGAQSHGLLIVLQGMDASGKDGTIRKAFTFLNPLGCLAKPFRAPSEEESRHDFLWRVHRFVPERGGVSIFNRSHYEDILVPVVREGVSEEFVTKRISHINDFEKLLSESGTFIVKIFLHISKEEQKERLEDREKETEKSWKIDVGDWKDRELWDKYQKTYETLLNSTSHSHAPWFVVPADKKWYRNYAVLKAVVDTIEPMGDVWKKKLENMSQDRLKELAEFRRNHSL